MGVGGSVGWGVYRGVVTGVGITDGIIFWIDDGSDLDYSDVAFDGLSNGKYVGLFLYE